MLPGVIGTPRGVEGTAALGVEGTAALGVDGAAPRTGVIGTRDVIAGVIGTFGV